MKQTKMLIMKSFRFKGGRSFHIGKYVLILFYMSECLSDGKELKKLPFINVRYSFWKAAKQIA